MSDPEVMKMSQDNFLLKTEFVLDLSQPREFVLRLIFVMGSNIKLKQCLEPVS